MYTGLQKTVSLATRQHHFQVLASLTISVPTMSKSLGLLCPAYSDKSCSSIKQNIIFVNLITPQRSKVERNS